MNELPTWRLGCSRCLPSGAPPVNETYQEEAVYQNYGGNNRPVATNSTFRAETNDEHLYNHIELSNRQPVPSGAPAANQIYQEEAPNQTYEGNNRPQEPMKNIAIRHRMSFAMIAVLVLSLLATVGASISLAIMMSSDGGQDGRVVDEMKHLNKSKEVRNLTGEWITTDLKEDIMATKHQTEEMQRMTADLKKDIMATKNQTEGMLRMTTDLKKDIMATNLTNVHQTKDMQQMTADLKKDIIATKNQAEEMQRMTADLKKDIMATKNQTEEMQRMTRHFKKEIMATNANQTQEMQWMIADLIKEMKVTNVNRTEERTAFHHILQHWATKLEMWAMKVNQTVEGHLSGTAKNCAELYKAGKTISGVYTIDPDGKGAFDVFCDQKTTGGGWTVFQKRLDGSVDFYRYWDDYKNGFGNLNGEFWLGLDKIYRLTNKKCNRLRVELEDTTGNTAYAEYDMFAVTNETTKYKLSLGMYSGTAGDSLTRWHRDRPFTTRDRDHDEAAKVNCAVRYRGAWWYSNCHDASLNGFYYNSSHSNTGHGIMWHTWKGNNYSVKRAEMKIRPVNF